MKWQEHENPKQNEIWICKDGTRIKVKDMDEQHVRNSLNMMLKKQRILESLGLDSCDEIHPFDF